jgi:hypothetical protein
MNSLIKNEIEEETIETEAHIQSFMEYVKEDVDLLRSGAGEENIYLSCTIDTVCLDKAPSWQETLYCSLLDFTGNVPLAFLFNTMCVD